MGTVSEPPPPRKAKSTIREVPLAVRQRDTLRDGGATAVDKASNQRGSLAPRPVREVFSTTFRHLDVTTLRASAKPSAMQGCDLPERQRSSRRDPEARNLLSSDLSTHSIAYCQKERAFGTSLRPNPPDADSRTETMPTLGALAVRATPNRVGAEPFDSYGTEVRAKGINFTAGLEAIQRLYGPAARECIEKETPGALGDALRSGGIVLGGWYSVAWYREFLQSMRNNLGVNEAAARRIGHCVTGISVNVAYRALARMTSTKMLVSMSKRAFGYYFQPGTLLVTLTEPKRLNAKWCDCDGFDSMIWSVVEGTFLYFVEATGAKNVTLAVMSGGDAANQMLATASWR